MTVGFFCLACQRRAGVGHECPAAIPAATFLSAVIPGGLVELRALPSKAQAFYAVSDTDAISAFMARHRHENIYFGVAARRDSTSGKAENCASLSVLFADIDFKAFQDGEAGARQALARFPLPPSIVIATGGGLHVYWILEGRG